MTKQKQRGHGEGSIYQRKDGRWAASITLEGGKRNQARRPEQSVEMLAFTHQHSPYTEIIYIRGGKRHSNVNGLQRQVAEHCDKQEPRRLMAT